MSSMLKTPFFTTLIFLCVTIPSSLGRIGKRSLSTEYKHIRPVAEKSKLISDGECSIIVDKIPDYRSRSKLQSHPRLCVRLNDTQLLARLRQVGEFNPRFMAINEKDACRFRDLYSKDKLPIKIYPFQKGRQYQYPKRRLESCVSQSQSYRCRSGGTPVDKRGLIRLCTECNRVTELKDGVFPKFINEVKCVSGHCLDHQGLCVQRSLEFTFIYFTKEYVWHQTISDDPPLHVYVEVWDPYTQEIGVCCECQKFP